MGIGKIKKRTNQEEMVAKQRIGTLSNKAIAVYALYLLGDGKSVFTLRTSPQNVTS